MIDKKHILSLENKDRMMYQFYICIRYNCHKIDTPFYVSLPHSVLIGVPRWLPALLHKPYIKWELFHIYRAMDKLLKKNN